MKNLLVIIGVLLSVLFLWLALKDTNLNEIRHAFADARYWPMVPMFATLFGFYWLKAIRWSVLLSPSHRVPGNQLIPAMMAGAAGNNLLPAHFGELVRVYFAGKKFDIPKSTVLATLVVERLFDLIVVLVIFSVALLSGEYSARFYHGAIFLLVVALIITVASGLLTFHTDRFTGFIQNRLTFLSEHLRSKIAEQVDNLSDGLMALRQKNLYIEVVLNSFAQWLLMAGCLYCALLAFNIDASPMVAIVILGFTVVGLTLPTSPGFFGTIEYCFVLGLATVGVDASTALSAAIFYHLPAWTVVTVVGVVLLRLYHLSFRESRAGVVGS
ncbi:MAG: lysylphosphatidylglycerol synthase transmembrane domain-containing protein [Pseudomonadota bacterium]